MQPPRPIGIELRHLRYFLAVMDELHFRRAADRVHISQPPLSQAIRKLEDELEVQLLYRTSRAVSPTAAGKVFAEEARKVLAAFDLAVAEARRAGGAAPPLRVGCTPALPIEQLQAFLGVLRTRVPEVLVDVTHAPRAEQARRLGLGELDLGIFHHADGDEGLETEALFAGEPLAVLLSPDHRLVGREVLGPNDLDEETLVTWSRTANPAIYDRMLELLAAAGYRFGQVREVADRDPRDVIVRVASGDGIAIAPFSAKETSGAGDMIIRRTLAPEVLMPEMVLAWRSNAPSQLQSQLGVVRQAAREVRRASDGSAHA
jgi:DNA-binding transcriptional LysR family regulator